MKCPKCQTKHSYKSGMTCSCGYQFVFDPKRDQYTDGKFMGLIKATSANNTYYYTLNQLYGEFCRKNVANPKLRFFFSFLFLAAGLSVIWFFPGVLCLGVFLLVGSLACFGAAYSVLGNRNISRDKFDGMFEKWQKKNPDTLQQLIAKPRLSEPPPEWPEGDLYDYGVERVIIVEHDLFVDMLVLNNLHADQKALVISESGYPQYLLPRLEKLMDESPSLPVFLLHDSTQHGQDMENRLVWGNKFWLNGHPIVDLGLFPKDVQRMSRVKAFQPEKNQHQIPLDYLLYGTLLGGLAVALPQQTALGALMEPRPGTDAEGGASFG